MTNKLQIIFKAAALSMALLPAYPSWAQNTAPAPVTMEQDDPSVILKEKVKYSRMLVDSLKLHQLPRAAEESVVNRLRAIITGDESDPVRSATFSLFSQLASTRADFLPVVIGTALELSTDKNPSIVSDTFYFLQHTVPQPGPDSDKVIEMLRRGMNHTNEVVSLVAGQHLDMIQDDMPFYQEQIIDIALEHILHYRGGTRNHVTNILRDYALTNPGKAGRVISALKDAGLDPDKQVEYVSDYRGMGGMSSGGSVSMTYAFFGAFDTLTQIAADERSPAGGEIYEYFSSMADTSHPEHMRLRALDAIANSLWQTKDKYIGIAYATAEKHINDPSVQIRNSVENILQDVATYSPGDAEKIVDILTKALATETDPLRRSAKIDIIANIGKDHPALLPGAMALLFQTAGDVNGDLGTRSRALSKLGFLFSSSPGYQTDIMAAFIKHSHDPAWQIVKDSVAGLRIAANANNIYSNTAFTRMKEIQPLYAGNSAVTEEIARAYGIVFLVDDKNAHDALTAISSLRHDENSSVRNMAANSLASATAKRPGMAREAISYIIDMLRYTDPQTRRNTINAIGKAGTATIVADTATNTLATIAQNASEALEFRTASVANISTIAISNPASADKNLSLLEKFLNDPVVPFVDSVLKNIIRIGDANNEVARRVMDTLALFENSPEDTLKKTVAEPLKKLRDLLGFREFRQMVNDEAALTAKLPGALKDLSLAQQILPPAIALLRNAADDPILRLKAAEIVGPLGHAHASLAADAAAALGDVIVRDEPGNQAATLRTMMQKMGLIGMTHQSAAPAVIAAAAQLTGSPDSTLSGMAVTAIGMIGNKYPALTGDAAAALCTIATADDIPGRAAQTQLKKLKPAAQCPAP